LDFNDGRWQTWTRLMKQTQEGDAGAYERLLLEISPLVFHYVRKRVFNPQHVEDVYQDVLLTFHKARHTYRVERPFGPWFFAVIRNAIWSTLQKNRRVAQREVLLEELPEFAALEEGEDPVDDRLQRALESLPEIYRGAVERLKFKGMTVETAAKELGISKIALRVRAHRGYRLLKKFLTRQEKNQ